MWVRSLLLTSRLEIRSKAHRERSNLRQSQAYLLKGRARSAPLLGVIRQPASRRQPQRLPASSIKSKPPLAATVQYVAPASVVVAARLSAPLEVRGSDHYFVVAAIQRGRVGFTPAHIENVQPGVGIGLTPGQYARAT
jgi:hypothetical protein